jgi:CRP-like cAMP-binding protein
MANQHPLASLLRSFCARTALDEREQNIILALPFTLRSFAPLDYLARDGAVPGPCPVLVSGFAFCQKLASDGSRQIVSIHIPGEALDLQQIFLSRGDHSVQALTEISAALIPRKDLQGLVRAEPNIATAVSVHLEVEASILREGMLRLGRRSALQRVAHLICEFSARMYDAELSELDQCELPMTQEQIGDMLGLTSVHVNRTLKALEVDGLIVRNKRNLRMPNVQALRRIADFRDEYLHFGHQQGS